MSSVETRFHDAFDRERVRLIRQGDSLRLVAVGGFTAIHAVLGYGLGQIDWRGNLSIWLVYVLLAAAAAIVNRRWDAVARRGGFVIPFVDMPMLCVLQAVLAPQTSDPTAIVGFTAGPYVLLILWSALTLDRRLIVVAAVMAAIFQSVLFVRVGSDVGGLIASALLMGTAAGITYFAAGRLVRLVRNVTTEEVRAADAEHLSAEKDRFVSTVSHDFRSPLAIVLSAIQTVMDDSEMPPETRTRFLQRAERQCRRLLAMVNDLLDLARIEGRASALAEHEIGEVVAECIEAARGAFDDASVTLVYEPAPSPIHIELDRALFERALSNLLDNAKKFSAEGERVQLRVENEGGLVRISVQDAGCGVPVEEHEHLFEPFFQGERGASRGDGSGLGLSVVSEVARKHGGLARVESTVGQGSTFFIELPLHRVEGG